jgi:hypothetical protein
MKAIVAISVATILVTSLGAAAAGPHASASGAAHANSHSGISADLDSHGNSADHANGHGGGGAGVDIGVGVDRSGPKASTSVGSDVSGSAGTMGKAKAEGTASGADKGASGETYGAVISSIRSGSSADVDLSSVEDSEDVNIVMLSSLKGKAASRANALDQALAANKTARTKLQAEIEDNDAISSKLEADHFTSKEVVAVKTSADGTVTVYVDDRG